MSSHLYFVCPTDHLEPLINKVFKGENYFVSTLGNSLAFDAESTLSLIDLFDTKQVTNITFALASDNSIIEDAIEKKAFSSVDGIGEFYSNIEVKKRDSELLYKAQQSNQLIVSYHLHEKIKELQGQLSVSLKAMLNIDGKVYNRVKSTFNTIYPDLIYGNLGSLN